MTIDELYHQLLKTQEGLHEVWKQQPDNLAGLRKYTERLRSQMNALSKSLGKEEPTGKPTSVEKPTSVDSVMGHPSGPVSPSKKPSREKDLESRRKATLERLLPSGPAEGPKDPPSLVKVPKPWMQKSLNQAIEEVRSLEDILKSLPSDRSAIQRSMGELSTILHQMGNPPPTAPPVAPRELR